MLATQIVDRLRHWVFRELTSPRADPRTLARSLGVEIVPGATSLAGGTHIGCGGTLEPKRFELETGVIHPMQCSRCEYCWYAVADLKVVRNWLDSTRHANDSRTQA